MDLVDYDKRIRELEDANRNLQEKLKTSEADRMRLEALKDQNDSLLKKVIGELQESQKAIKEKSDELETTLNKLRATQEQIVAQEKLASLGALTAGIAHEIKNPLNFVNNFAELSVELITEILEEIDHQKSQLDPESIEYLQGILTDLEENIKKINHHGRRADNIVHGMLMHSRGQAGERRLTDINALLAEYVNLAYHGMRANNSDFNVTIKEEYDQGLEPMNVVPQNLSRVFLNLVNNACYATYHRFLQERKKSGEEFFPTLWVKTKDLGHQVEIKIRDNGIGISSDIVDKIFNPFFTTKPTGEGTGLGLSISHDIIVQEHQGGIRVETEANQYTEFIITLPK